MGVLGVPPNATFKEIKAAYQLLVKVWHPDRFQSDNAVLGAVDARMKEVNSAFAFLKEHPDPVHQRPSEFDPPAPFAHPSSSVCPSQGAVAVLRTLRGLIPSRRSAGRLTGALIALLLIRYTWIALDFGSVADPGVNGILQSGKERLLNGLEQPKHRVLAAVKSDLDKLNPFKLRYSQPEELEGKRTEIPPLQAKPKPADRAPRTRNAGPTHVQTVLPFITIGSTRSEIIRLLGPPTSSSEDQLTYGQSVLFLRGDSVVGWRIDPVSAPLRVKMWPATAVDPGLERFALGSSKDDVLAVQGTPTAFSRDTFEYGHSLVFFKDDRVIGWKSDLTSISLRVAAR